MPNQRLDDKIYEKLGEMVALDIQQQMKNQFGLEEIVLPLPEHRTATSAAASLSIFKTKNALSQPKKLLVIICGSGHVK